MAVISDCREAKVCCQLITSHILTRCHCLLAGFSLTTGLHGICADSKLHLTCVTLSFPLYPVCAKSAIKHHEPNQILSNNPFCPKMGCLVHYWNIFSIFDIWQCFHSELRDGNGMDRWTDNAILKCIPIERARPHAGFRVARIDPLHFLAGCCTRRLNQI